MRTKFSNEKTQSANSTAKLIQDNFIVTIDIKSGKDKQTTIQVSDPNGKAPAFAVEIIEGSGISHISYNGFYFTDAESHGEEDLPIVLAVLLEGQYEYRGYSLLGTGFLKRVEIEVQRGDYAIRSTAYEQGIVAAEVWKKWQDKALQPQGYAAK